MTLDAVIRLEDFRPKAPAPQPPASPADWRLIDQLCDDLALVENVQGQVRAMLGGLLIACLDAEVTPIAQGYWFAIKSVILAPLSAPKVGEAVFQPMLDKLRTIDAYAREFFRNVKRPGPRYQPNDLEAETCN